jgi:hypothetical protein
MTAGGGEWGTRGVVIIIIIIVIVVNIVIVIVIADLIGLEGGEGEGGGPEPREVRLAHERHRPTCHGCTPAVSTENGERSTSLFASFH